MGTVLCTHKRDFATVTLIPGQCFDRGGGGGIGFYNNRGEEPNFSIFPESLGPKGSDWCSFQVDGPPQAILEPRRVRVTLIPGSTLALFALFSLCQMFFHTRKNVYQHSHHLRKAEPRRCGQKCLQRDFFILAF